MTKNADHHKREIINQTLNFFWTIFAFTPVIWFWVLQGINLNFYLFLGSAIITAMLPVKILRLFTLSSDKRLYEKLGVKYIRKFVQNGDMANRISGAHKPAAIQGKVQAQRYLKTIAMYERYHWAGFTFFILTGVYCLSAGTIQLGVSIMITNMLYNVAPVLLQQYNRIRIMKIDLLFR